MGPSSSGKSTLLNIISGIETVTSDEVYYQDLALHQATAKELTTFRRQHIGFVFQFYNLMPNLTALENIQLAAEISEHPLAPEVGHW